jgi:hypothetical protein
VRNSYDLMIEDLAWHGIGPLAHELGPRRSRFAKSHPLPTSTGGAFDQCVRDCAAFIEAERRSNAAKAAATARRRRHERTMAKAFSDLDQMAKSLPTPAAVSAEVHEAPSRAAETVTKAFHALRNDVWLTPEQRGRAMIALSDLADRVFAKAETPVHPYVERIEKVQAMLRRALAEKKIGQAEPLTRKLLADIERGDFDHGDHVRLELLLAELKRELMKETKNDEEA